MRKLLAKGLVIIIDAGLLVLADLIIKGSKRNDNFHGMHRGYSGGDAVALRYPGAGRPMHSWRGVRDKHGRRRSIS